MTQKQKTDFRMSPAWKKFRVLCKKAHNYTDFVTRQVLGKHWHLHHLDMRDEHYTNITDVERFVPLNSETHDFMHWCYRLWLKDPAVLERIRILLERMKACNND